MKRILSYVLVFAMIFSVFTMGAIGASAEGEQEELPSVQYNVYNSNSSFEYPGEIPECLHLITYVWEEDATFVRNTLGIVNGFCTATEGYAIVTLKGSDGTLQTLKVTRFVNWVGDSYSFIRFNLSDDGGYTVDGVSYTATVDLYSNDGTPVAKSNELSTKTTETTANVPEDYPNLTASGRIGNQSNACGFIDSNVTFDQTISVSSLSDIKILVNGKSAWWNIGYLGEKHCGIKDEHKIQIGIVGAEINPGWNSVTLIMGDTGDVYSQSFNSTFTSRGVTYSKVEADKTTDTVTAVIIYNTAPGYKVGDTLTGKCHDDHDNTATFKVTAVDGNKVTMVAENYVPNQSLLELQDKDKVYTTVTINTTSISASDPQALSDANTNVVINSGSKQILTGISSVKNSDGSVFGTVANLFDGKTSPKLEGGWPSGGITVTFKAESAIKATYLVLYTHDDGRYGNRAPQEFILSGSADGTTYTEIKHVYTSGIQNASDKAFSFALNGDTAYEYYKLEVLSNLGNGGHFQIGELELYTANVNLPDPIPADGIYTVVQGIKDSSSGYKTTANLQYRRTPIKDENNVTIGESETTYDVRLVVLINDDLLPLYDSADMYLTFETGSGALITKKNDKTITTAFKTVTGAGITSTAPEGYSYVGLVVKGVKYEDAVQSISARIELTVGEDEKLVIPFGTITAIPQSAGDSYFGA